MQAARYHIHAIQASILLALYFFVVDRPLEGQYHANSAATLALSAGLHKIFANADQADPSQSIALFVLPPAVDVVELGERIRVFWEVYFLDRCWSVALRVPCVIVDDATVRTRIDTPWPQDIVEYAQVPFSVLHKD